MSKARFEEAHRTQQNKMKNCANKNGSDKVVLQVVVVFH